MSDNPRTFNLEYNPPAAPEQPEDQEMQDHIPNNEEQEDDDATPKMQEEYDQNGENAAEDGDLTNTVIELEKEFHMTHDPETGAQLLQIYRNVEDMENVRRIRESLLEYSSLTEKDWLDWIEDEINVAKTDEEKKAVLKLVDRALEESLFFDVAKLGISYVKGLFNQGVTRRQGVKITIEKAINAFCYDFYNGSKFFKKLRKFELGNADLKEAEKEKIIRGLYERQLKLPYADIDQTIDEYVTWEKNQGERERMVKVYEETYKDINTHMDFEERFQEALDDPDDTEKFLAVLTEIVDTDKLKLEKKINFFERCVVANPAEPILWEKYSELAEKNLRGNSSALERIYRRAVKNCSGNMQFTKSYLRVLEKLGTEPEKLKEKILSFLWHFRSAADYYYLRLQLCEIYVRLLNAKLIEVKGDTTKAKEEAIRFRQAVQEAIQFFSGDQSAEYQAYIANLWLFKANIETYTLKDKQQMNQSMDKYVQHSGSQFSAWSQYVTFEQALGRPDSVRRILKRGCEYTKDDIAAMFTLAIEYERKFGSLEELENAEKRFQEKKEKLAQEDPTNTALTADNNNLPKPLEPTGKKAKAKEKEKEKEKGKEKDRKSTKRRITDKMQAEPEEQKQVEHIEKQVKKTEQREEPTMQEEKKQEEPVKVTQPPPVRETPAYPEELDKKNTVFVRNFPITFTKEDIRAIFVNADKITDLRFGKTKGTAYIDFATNADAETACECNDMNIDGQKLFVALSDSHKKGKDDKNTLFVNNLPFDITKEALLEPFKKWESHILVQDTRIPTAENGKAKGFAYVVFDSDSILDGIIAECHDLHIGGRKVHVEHADSSKRQREKVLPALHVAFIRGLNFKAREEDLQEFFKDFNVRQVHLVRDKKTRKPTGIAFVEFATLEDLRSAIALPEPKILGRQIDISKSDRPITQSHENEAQEARPKKNFLSKKDAAEPVPAKPSNFPVPMQIKKMVPASASNTMPAATNTAATNAAPAGMKSNDQFRALLMKKK